MLTLPGNNPRCLDNRLSRRSFLQVGSLGIGSLTLADLLRLRAQGAVRPRSSHKAVIMIYLTGGPSQMDMYDMKPDAPAEYRGEFKPIKTNVPGLDVCELMSLQATIADKLAIIRNMKFRAPDHSPDEVFCGFPMDRGKFPNRPTLGAVVSKLRNQNDTGMPPYVKLGEESPFYKAAREPAFLGSAYSPFDPHGPEGMKNLGLNPQVTLARMHSRKDLLANFDTLRRDLEVRGELAGLDVFTARALEMLTSAKVRDAFDVTKEPLAVREKCGKDTSWLQARRLVEAGVSVVRFDCFSYGWDNHSNIFPTLRKQVPGLDRVIHALVTDLHDRGLLQDVAVVAWGEMGRSPKIGTQAKLNAAFANGRDHWNDAGFALVAGGGFQTGQAIGVTSPRGERSTDRSYTPQNVLATLYAHLGIDPATTLPDLSGRPIYLLDERERVRELG